MILKVGSFEFVLTRVELSDRRVIAVREVNGPEICIDMTKQQAATLADAISALAK